jgi:hypothetical protein
MEGGKVKALNSDGSMVIAGQKHNLPHLFQTSGVRKTIPRKTAERIKNNDS